MGIGTIVSLISAALKLFGFAEAAEAFLARYGKVDPIQQKEIERVQTLQIKDAARPDLPPNDVLGQLSDGGSGP